MSFQEILFQDYKAMLDIKEAMGYDRETYRYYLPDFITFCSEKYPESEYLTKEMLDGWLTVYCFRKKATQAHAISTIRAFTGYQAAIGKRTFIPSDEYAVKVEHYVPYIFDDRELSRLFHAFDTIAPNFEAPKREIIVPVLFRMMFCCGMRPAEPLHLRCEDVDLNTGDIYIRQSKSRKDRHIVMSVDMLGLCRRYDILAGSRTWFFEHWDRHEFPTYWMTNQFRICWRNSGLEKRGNPRPYDLRHGFATRTMMRWIDEGRDIMALLPYLSTYMGHKSFKHTLYYIHLLPKRLRSSVGIDWERFSTIYPEVQDEED